MSAVGQDAAARASVTVTHPTGIHARPSVKLARMAKGFAATAIRLRQAPDGPWIDAKSVVKVMGMKARRGAVLELEASGDEAEPALAALVALVVRDFDETTEAEAGSGDPPGAHG